MEQKVSTTKMSNAPVRKLTRLGMLWTNAGAIVRYPRQQRTNADDVKGVGKAWIDEDLGSGTGWD